MEYMNAMVVIAYLLSMVGFGFYLSRFIKKDDDFFLAGRSLNKWVIAGTIMATNVAAIYLVGPAAAAFAGGGFSVLLIAWTGNMVAAGSALFFVPRLRRLQITTVSEFLEERYGLWLRLLPAFLWIVYYALFSGNAMYTLSTVLSPVLKLEIATIIVLVGAGVVLYCFFSGLVAVAYSSVIQAFLMIIGGLILLPLCLKHPNVGGVSGFVEKIPESYFVFWKTGDIWPNYKTVIMFALLGLPYWCTSQYMLQRSFAGRSVRHASRGLILAALLTGPLTLSYIIPGICGTLIYPAEKFANSTSDPVLPTMIVDIMPVGLAGILIAALVAASNSTASSLLNSLATLTEHDFYRRFVPNKSSRHYIWVGRSATLIGGIVGIVFAFFVPKLGGIIEANFAIMSFFEPPIFVIVAAALFWRSANGLGAAAALLFGVGFSCFTAFFKEPAMTATDRTIYCFPVCIAAMIIFSIIGRKCSSNFAKDQRIDELLSRSRGTRIEFFSPSGMVGISIALISITAFVFFAFNESMIIKPYNLIVYMGFMLSFVVGCYIAVPAFTPSAEKEREVEKTDMDRSLTYKLIGNGWSWLVTYLIAVVIVIILYLW